MNIDSLKKEAFFFSLHVDGMEIATAKPARPRRQSSALLPNSRPVLPRPSAVVVQEKKRTLNSCWLNASNGPYIYMNINNCKASQEKG